MCIVPRHIRGVSESHDLETDIHGRAKLTVLLALGRRKKEKSSRFSE